MSKLVLAITLAGAATGAAALKPVDRMDAASVTLERNVAPLPTLPMPRGVRTASMMYASAIRFLPNMLNWTGWGKLIPFPSTEGNLCPSVKD